MFYELTRYDQSSKVKLDACILSRVELLDKLNTILGYDPKQRIAVKNKIDLIDSEEIDDIWFESTYSSLNDKYKFRYELKKFK